MPEKPEPETLLAVQLSVQYGNKPPVLGDVRFDIQRGEVVGLIGQSGSGKSTLAMAILGLLDRKRVITQGFIWFEGSDLLALREAELRTVRGQKIALVLQSPVSSLNPVLKIRTQLREAWRAHASGSNTDRDSAIRAALESVSLPAGDDFLGKYPAQMSIGQAQRVLIAMAIIHSPALLIADEATSALDVITQAEILKLFRHLSQNSSMAILYISHDLASVAGICDRVAILHEGQIVETGITHHVLTNPHHDYTRRLLTSMPRMPETSAMAIAAAR